MKITKYLMRIRWNGSVEKFIHRSRGFELFDCHLLV